MASGLLHTVLDCWLGSLASKLVGVVVSHHWGARIEHDNESESQV